MEQVVQAHLLRRHRAYFTALEQVVSLADRAVYRVIQKRLQTSVQAVALTIFTRTYNTLVSCRLLLTNGFGLQAGMLTRSVLEDFINLHFITENTKTRPEDLARRYIMYQQMVPVRTLEVLRSLGREVSAEKEAVAIAAGAAFRSEYPDGREDDWAGTNLREKAKQAGAEEAYLLLQQELSGLLHGAPSAWQRLVNEEGTSATFLVGPQDIYIREPIPALCVFTATSIQTVGKVFDLPSLTDEAVTLVKELARQWETDS